MLACDLLCNVEDISHVTIGPSHAASQVEHDREATLHVGRTEAPQCRPVDLRNRIAVRRDGVEVASEHHSVRQAEIGAGDHVVADTHHVQPGVTAQEALDVVSDQAFFGGQ